MGWFQHGDLQTKKLILETIGSNPVLTDKILSIEARKPFKRPSLESNCSTMRAFIDDFRTFVTKNDAEAQLVVRNTRLLREQFEKEELELKKAA
jgi:hypothetical protein